MTTVQPEVREVKQFIGGTWVDAADGATFDDLDPFTGDVVARVPAGGRADAERAVVAGAAGGAAGGFPEGGRHPREPDGRGRVAARARDGLHVRLRDVPDALRAGSAAPGGGDA